MGIGRELNTLMDMLNYRFNDISHLEIALTHTSYTNEMKKRGFRAQSNEAYEFLGDAILELVISEELFLRFSGEGEGALSKMRQSLVCESTLAKIAANINLGDYLNIGTGEEGTDVRCSSKVLADALEAVFAAVYLDDIQDGRRNYRAVILALFEDEMRAGVSRGSLDYKTMLQQFAEKNPGTELHYEYLESGPEHNKEFVAVAYINNNKVGEGCGRTKRQAEREAARCALKLFGMIG